MPTGVPCPHSGATPAPRSTSTALKGLHDDTIWQTTRIYRRGGIRSSRRSRARFGGASAGHHAAGPAVGRLQHLRLRRHRQRRVSVHVRQRGGGRGRGERLLAELRRLHERDRQWRRPGCRRQSVDDQRLGEWRHRRGWRDDGRLDRIEQRQCWRFVELPVWSDQRQPERERQRHGRGAGVGGKVSVGGRPLSSMPRNQPSPPPRPMFPRSTTRRRRRTSPRCRKISRACRPRPAIRSARTRPALMCSTARKAGDNVFNVTEAQFPPCPAIR